ncbi:MAG: glycosyltransferase family 39 protein [Ignavibacteriae bacterium]|nr:glycosyltransferase family 39 protein [Ignavibacteriota bacterium]
MSLSTRQHNAIALLVFCALLVFFRLNSAPLQPMETLLAFKADLILQFNGFFDLAPYFSGYGNAQFAMPPMGIWFAALSMKFLGNLPLHLRLPSVFCSAASLVLLYQIARRITGNQLALVAPVLLASTLAWNMLARQAGGDISAVMFTLLSLWTLIFLGELKTQSGKLKTVSSFVGFVILYIVSIAGSLLSGLYAGAIAIVMFGVMIPYLGKKNSIGAFLGLLSGITIAGLWYNHVYLSISGLLAKGISIDGIVKTFLSGLLAQPFIIFAVIAPILMVIVNRKSNSKAKYRSIEYALVLWFVLAILTGGLTYSEFFPESSSIVLLAPSAILLGIRGYELAGASSQNVRLMWVMIICLGVTLACSLSEGAQNILTGIFHASGNLFGSLMPLLIILVVMGIGFILPKNRLYQMTARLTLWIGIVVPVLLILRIVVLNISKPSSLNELKTEASDFYQGITKDKKQVLLYEECKIWREH